MTRYTKSQLLDTTARVRDFNQEGEGIAPLNSPLSELNGRIVFISQCVPGDLLAITGLTQKGRQLKVESFDYLSYSPTRQRPFCPHFENCGGCQLQHINYEASLAWKNKRVQDSLERVAKLDPQLVSETLAPCIGMDNPYAYRSIVRYHLSRTKKLGFHARAGHEVIAQDYCYIQSPNMNRIRDYLTESFSQISQDDLAKLLSVELRQNHEEDAYMLVFHFSEKPLDSTFQNLGKSIKNFFSEQFPEASLSLWTSVQGQFSHICGPLKLQTCENAVNLAYSPQAFQQTNLRQNARLYAEVVKSVKAACAALGREDIKLLELYCGSASLSLQLAHHLPNIQITAVEQVAEAIEDARYNQSQNALPHELDFIAARAEEYFAQMFSDSAGESTMRPDILLVDPPRQGLDAQLVQNICQAQIPHMVYVSCDPASLARDLKVLKSEYHLRKVQALDMFPWTTHVETIAQIQRKKS